MRPKHPVRRRPFASPATRPIDSDQATFLTGGQIVFLAFLAAAAALAAPGSTAFSDGRPPARFQGDATLVLEVTDQAGIERTCHPLFGTPPAGMKTNACQTGDRMIVPNPCRYSQTETYARLLCHELGHANGWASSHGEDGQPVARAARPADAAEPAGAATSDSLPR